MVEGTNRFCIERLLGSVTTFPNRDADWASVPAAGRAEGTEIMKNEGEILCGFIKCTTCIPCFIQLRWPCVQMIWYLQVHTVVNQKAC